MDHHTDSRDRHGKGLDGALQVMTADFAAGLAIGLLCGFVCHVLATVVREFVQSLRN
jgi:hypothetical protein